MQSKITERFWEDEDIAALQTDEKLAVVWLITNAGVNILGLTEVSPRKFSFDTGMPIETLWRATQALPRACVRDGHSVLLLNFIRHQIGEGESLVDNTNMFKSVRRAFQGLNRDNFRAALLAKYPQLSLPLPTPCKPSVALASPSSTPKPLQGLASPCKGKEKEKEKEEEKEKENLSSGKGSGEGFCPDPSEVFEYAASFAGEPASGTPGPIAPEFAKAWLARMEHRREFPPRWQRALVAEWRSGWQTFAVASSGVHPQKNGAKNPGPVSANVAAIQDGKRRTELERQLREAQSAFNAHDLSGDDEGAAPYAKTVRRLQRELAAFAPAVKEVA